jgi:DNA primase
VAVIERLYEVLESAARFYSDALETAPFSELARGALEERGITAETAARFRLGYAPAQWDALTQHLRAKRFSPADGELAGLLLPGRGGYYDRFRHRLMFPVLDRAGRVVAFSGRILPVSEAIPEGIVPTETGKYINSPETPIYRKGEHLYGLTNALTAMRRNAEAILVEGNFDVLQMHQHGFTETVAPLGTSFTEAQARLLRRFVETVVLALDGDEGGRCATERAGAIARTEGLRVLVQALPEGLDPDTALRRGVWPRGPSVHWVEWLIRREGERCRPWVPYRVRALRRVAPWIARESPSARAYLTRATCEALDLEAWAVVRAVSDNLRDTTQLRQRSRRPVPPRSSA